MKRILQLSILMLIFSMLCGCGHQEMVNWYLDQWQGLKATQPPVSYGDMEYVRPDMDEHDRILEESCRIARESQDLLQLEEAVYAYYDIYDLIYAAYDLSYLRYCADVTDTYWEQEYDFCAENIAAVDAGLEALNYALAQSPLRETLETEEYFGEDYFDAYEGENLWDDPELMSLLQQETALVDQYYTLCAEAESVEYDSQVYYDNYAAPMGQVYVELIALRQQIAAYFGYDSYPEFAYDYYHYRDYTPAEAERYLEAVATELAEPYRRVIASDIWELSWEPSTEEETFQFVKEAVTAMDGDAADAFAHLEENGLYDISYGENKYPISFETFILYYYEPFVFVCPEGTVYDRLAFAHEFGHFTADYVCDGSYVGTDVAEVHSQAMEYLILCYGTDTRGLERIKMADSLCTYVEQAAYALFEHRVYDLRGDDLTVENVQALYESVGKSFGFDSWEFDSGEYVTIPHFFVLPMYTVSYVVSNDLAMQIYQLEKEETGAGIAVYEDCICSDDSYLLTFAQNYGLESPFAPGRLEAVRKIFEDVLG